MMLQRVATSLKLLNKEVSESPTILDTTPKLCNLESSFAGTGLHELAKQMRRTITAGMGKFDIRRWSMSGVPSCC